MFPSDLRLIPGLLGTLLIVASLGPWGSLGLSVRTQIGEFKARLEAAGMLRNGALTREPSPLEQSDMARVAGITAYLASVGVEE